MIPLKIYKYSTLVSAFKNPHKLITSDCFFLVEKFRQFIQLAVMILQDYFA